MTQDFTFLEFFAGGGMTRLGLGENWRCLFANDVDPQKCSAYRSHFGESDLREASISALKADDLPAIRADLMWGSFPCQDLSLAGARSGLAGARSGLFNEFWRLVRELSRRDIRPRIIALENVVGLLTVNNGEDFAAVAGALARGGYRVGACVIDARFFTPQSRPRLFIFGFDDSMATPHTDEPAISEFTPAAMHQGLRHLPPQLVEKWFWLAPTPSVRRNAQLSDIIDWRAPDWHDASTTATLLNMMSETQRRRIDAIAKSGARRAGAGFRRTRIENGKTVQRFEARFDGLAGCLRTPAGGSSRQIIVAIENGDIRTRLLVPREAARLMGLPDEYALPDRANAALKLAGDGVCVPVVDWIARTILEPALTTGKLRQVA